MISRHLGYLATAIFLCAVAACSSTTNGAGSLAAGTHVSATPDTSAVPSTSASATRSSASPSPTTPSVTVIPAPSNPLRTATVTSGGVTYRIDIWVETRDANCAAHAYGSPVIAYLQAHPCSGLTRQLATTTVNGKSVGINTSSLAFVGTDPSIYQTAGNFRALVLQDGTGNVNDLLREGRRLPSGPTSLPSPDAFTALGQDAGVMIYDIWYLDGPTPNNDPPLIKMAQNIFLQY